MGNKLVIGMEPGLRKAGNIFVDLGVEEKEKRTLDCAVIGSICKQFLPSSHKQPSRTLLSAASFGKHTYSRT
jgi:hypothetical protein